MNPIAKVIFRKSPTVKNYLFVHSDKSIILRTFVIEDKTEKLSNNEKIVASKFGKTLIQRNDVHISAVTIGVMNHLANEYKFDVPEGFIQCGKITGNEINDLNEKSRKIKQIEQFENHPVEWEEYQSDGNGNWAKTDNTE